MLTRNSLVADSSSSDPIQAWRSTNNEFPDQPAIGISDRDEISANNGIGAGTSTILSMNGRSALTILIMNR